MLIRLSPSMSLQTRYLTKRGDVYQFYLRIPSDLVSRYGKQFIRTSLRTTDQKVAVREADSLARRFFSEFAALRSNKGALPLEASHDAKGLARALAEDDTLIDYILEPKRQAYAASSPDPEATYATADIAEYLSPIEVQAVRMLHEGIETPRLSDALELYWKEHKRSGETDYVIAVERDWNRLIAFVGDIPLETLSRTVARRFVEHLLRSGLKTTSVRRKLNYVNAILNTAIRELELAKPNPFANLRIAGEGKDATPATVPDIAQLKEVIFSLQKRRSPTALLALIMIESGPRIAEISGLKITDVHLDTPVPYVRVLPNEWRDTKTDSSVREFPLVGVSLEAMKGALALPRTNAALFPSYARPKGNTAASAAVNKVLKPWGITSKSFRHSLKDRLRDVGCPKDIRDAIQGHENGEIAETYGKGHTLKTMYEWLEKAKIQ